MIRFQFSLRLLLLMTLVVATSIATLTYMGSLWRKHNRLGHLKANEWPLALQELIGDDADLRVDVRVYGLGSFFEDESVWYIKKDSPLIDLICEKHQLEPASPTHPKFPRLTTSIPHQWKPPDLSKCTILATPGFGSTYIEGVDLFLIVRDIDGGGTIVLHHWIF